MRHVQTQNEVDQFKEGIVRLLSNLLVYEVKKQYQEDPGRFRQTQNIHEYSDEEQEDDFESEADKTDEEAAEMNKDPNKLPFF